jgi:hypothetical protein
VPVGTLLRLLYLAGLAELVQPLLEPLDTDAARADQQSRERTTRRARTTPPRAYNPDAQRRPGSDQATPLSPP